MVSLAFGLVIGSLYFFPAFPVKLVTASTRYLLKLHILKSFKHSKDFQGVHVGLVLPLDPPNHRGSHFFHRLPIFPNHIPLPPESGKILLCDWIHGSLPSSDVSPTITWLWRSYVHPPWCLGLFVFDFFRDFMVS
ncbi:hypothetical protein ACFX1Q_033976 [Malus domestica]